MSAPGSSDQSRGRSGNCKEGISRLELAIERGFAQQRESTERQFAELRREMHTHFRWICGLIFTNMTFTFGILAHITSKL